MATANCNGSSLSAELAAALASRRPDSKIERFPEQTEQVKLAGFTGWISGLMPGGIPAAYNGTKPFLDLDPSP